MAGLSTKLPWELAQTKWPAQLNPILANPLLAGLQLDGIPLVAGVQKSINHMLGRMPQGWFLVDNSANAVIWRALPFSTNYVTLKSSADTTISIWVY